MTVGGVGATGRESDVKRFFGRLGVVGAVVGSLVVLVAAAAAPPPTLAQTTGFSVQNCIRVLNRGSPPRMVCAGSAGGGGAGTGLPAYERWDNGAPAVGNGFSGGGDGMPSDRGISSVHDYGR